MPNPYIKSWNVPNSDGDGEWKVSQRLDGSFACTCPAWRFHKAPKPPCHHIQAVKDDVATNPASAFRAACARALGDAQPCPRLEKEPMRTVPKKSPRAARVLTNAREIRCYSLSNNFTGTPLVNDPVIWAPDGQIKHVTPTEYLTHELETMPHAKLYDEGGGKFSLLVHSNLSYEFQSNI